MEELKEFVSNHPHVQTVYFDQHGNWFLHKGRTIVSEKTRAEILGKSKDEDKTDLGDGGENKGNKKKK